MLRFFEFQKELEQTSIGELTDTVMGYAFKSSEFVEAGIQLIRMGNLYQGTLQLERTPVFMPKLSEENYKRFVISSGDLIMSMTGTMGKRDYGFILKIPQTSQNYLLNQRVMKFVVKGNNSADFLLYLLQNEKLLNRLYSLPGGTKQANLSGQQVKELNTYVPCALEQQKIADFLSSVDKKISLLKEKHALLEQYKKGVMKKLFSQDIRFKDESDNDFPDWVIEPIGRYLEEYKERVPVGTDIPVLTSSRTGLYLQERKVINEGELGVVPKGYFTYRHMSDDLVFKFNLNRVWDKGAVSKEYPVFKAVGMNSYFLELSLNEGDDFKRFAIQQKVGGTRTRLYYKNLVKLKLNTPSLAEQNKIAGFLQTLDKKIKLVAEQIEQTQTFKKGLLQQMFV